MKNDFFDHIVKQKADGHRAPVPADAWENIQKARRKRKYVYFFWIIPIFLLLGIAVFFADRAQEKNLPTPRSGAAIPANSTTRQDRPARVGGTPGDPTIHAGSGSKPDAPVAAADAGQHVTMSPASQSKTTITTAAPTTDDADHQPASTVTQQYTNGQSTATHQKAVNSNARIHINQAAPDATDELSSIAPINDSNSIAVHHPSADSMTTDDKPHFIQQVFSPDKKTALHLNIAQKSKDAKPKKIHKYPWYIDLGVTPFFAMQQEDRPLAVKRITTNAMSTHEFTGDDIESRLEPSIGYTMALRKKITSKMAIGAGLQYSLIKEKLKIAGKETTTSYVIIKRMDSSNSFLVDDTVSTSTTGNRIIHAYNSYTFLSIPVSFQYNLLEHAAWSVSFNGGLLFNIKNSYHNSISGKPEPQFLPGNVAERKKHSFTTDVYAGIRFARFVGGKYQLYAEPLFQYNLFKQNMPGMLMPANIHRTGLTIGLSYKLP